MTSQPFPNANSSIVDKNGVLSPVWRNFFQALWNRTGGTTPAGSALLAGSENQVFNVAAAEIATQAVNLGQAEELFQPVGHYQPAGSYAALSGSATEAFDVAAAAAGTNATPLAQVEEMITTAQQTQGAAFVAITVDASPFAFTLPGRGAVAISGGTVTTISSTRGGATIPLGATAGLFPGTVGDIITATFTAAPIMNFAPS